MSTVGVRHPGCYGLTLDTDLPLHNRLAPGDGAEPVRVLTVEGPMPAAALGRGQVLVEAETTDHQGVPLAALHRVDASLVMRVLGVADYELAADHIRVHIADRTQLPLIELHLLGPVLSLWLEQRGIVALHGSAVVLDTGAVGFLAHQGAGKSTLAASLIRNGAQLLSDDLLAVEPSASGVWCRPGFATMRMWPEEVRHFTDAEAVAERVHAGTEKRRVPIGPDGFGDFCALARPLSALYVLCRSSEPAGAVRLEPVTGTDATVELMRHSFVGALAEAALGAPRMRSVAELARRLRIERLHYPSGPGGLGRAMDVVAGCGVSPPGTASGVTG